MFLTVSLIKIDRRHVVSKKIALWELAAGGGTGNIISGEEQRFVCYVLGIFTFLKKRLPDRWPVLQPNSVSVA
jgi:hypothetical protein